MTIICKMTVKMNERKRERNIDHFYLYRNKEGERNKNRRERVK